MALIEYKRATDVLHLAQDINMEVTDLMYIPVVESFEDLSVGISDPGKPGAIAGYMDAGKLKLATYNGDGTWSQVGSDSGPTRTPDPSLNFSTTSSDMDTAHPDASVGDIYYNVDGPSMYVAEKQGPGAWEIRQSGT